MATIDNYKLLHTLGSGSFSKVKLAEGPYGEELALKIMKRENTEHGKDLQSLFDNEVNFMKKLDHPNIIRLLDCSDKATAKKKDGRSMNINYMALEYAENGEIFDYVAETGAFKEPMARFYFHQLIDVLEYLHKQGISHRDLKPENVLLDSHFDIKLADFGFATESKTSNARKGTFGYMAPEILAKKQYVSAEADLFAAGIILFVLVTQHSPFSQADPNDRYYRLISQRRWDQFWKMYGKDTLSPEFKDLFEKMMNLNPYERLSLNEIKEHPFYTGHVASPKEIKRDMLKRQKKLKKKKKTEDEELSRLVTKFFSVSDGDDLVDAAVEVSKANGYKYKKSKEFFRIICKIEKNGVRTRIQVNVVRKDDEEKRCLELIKISGDEEVFQGAFRKFNDF